MMLLVRASTANRSPTTELSAPGRADAGPAGDWPLAAAETPEECFEHLHQAWRVAVDYREHLEVGLGGRQRIELVNQGLDQIDALDRRRNDHRVGAGVGGDLHVAEDSRLHQLPPAGVDGQETEHGRPLLVLGPGTLTGARRLTALRGAVHRRSRRRAVAAPIADVRMSTISLA